MSDTFLRRPLWLLDGEYAMSQGMSVEPSQKAAGMLLGRGHDGTQQGGRAGGKEKSLDSGFASEIKLHPFCIDLGPDREQAKMACMFLAWQLERRNCIN